MKRQSYDEAGAFSPIGRGVVRAFCWTFLPGLALLIVSALVR